VLLERLRQLGQILMGILKEIGDENAYARHLAARGVPASKDEWRLFSEARMKRKYMRAKCC
jgi:hypothetical protein